MIKVKLRPHTALKTTDAFKVQEHTQAAIQTYELFVQGQYVTRSTNEDQRRITIAIVVYLDNT